MKIKLLRAFWGCGDNEIIEFALFRARLNRVEKEVVRLILDECYTQEEAAEYLNLSVRKIQKIWFDAANKLINIAWVQAYSKFLLEGENNNE